jgi:hypothetical protein
VDASPDQPTNYYYIWVTVGRQDATFGLFHSFAFKNSTSFHLELSYSLPSPILIIIMASQIDNDSSAEIDSPSLEKGEGAKNVTEAIPEGQTEKLPEVPEGSLKAYLAVVGAFTAMFVSFGWVNCIALFQAEYETNQLKQYTSSQVSWITSMECKISLQIITRHTKWFAVFFMLFVSPLAGRMFDNYGPRLPIAIGTAMHVFGLMMASLSTQYYQFVLSQSVCSGIGASLIFGPAMTAVSSHFATSEGITNMLCLKLAHDLFQKETRDRRRFSNCRLVIGRCYFPNHCRAFDTKDWLLVGDASMCLSDSRPAHHH